MRKGVCPYENMDDWKKLNVTLLPEREYFYSHLNIKNITDADYAHAKRVWKDFETKNLREYHNLYVQICTSLLADVSHNRINNRLS